jgi:hypothetical protein
MLNLSLWLKRDKKANSLFCVVLIFLDECQFIIRDLVVGRAETAGDASCFCVETCLVKTRG